MLLLLLAGVACSSSPQGESLPKTVGGPQNGNDKPGLDVKSGADAATLVPDCLNDGDCAGRVAEVSACRPASCRLGECELGFADQGAPCQDGEPCTMPDHCAGGVCLPGQWTDCQDDNPCTTDSCDPLGGGCRHLPNFASCEVEGGCATGVCAQGQCNVQTRLFAQLAGAGLAAAVTAVVALHDGGLFVVTNVDLAGQATGAHWLRHDGAGSLQVSGALPFEHAMAAAPFFGGGAVVVGSVRTASGTLQGRAVGLADAATVSWIKDYGGNEDDHLAAVAPAPSGGWVAAGTTFSKGQGSGDIWYLRLDPTGFPLLDFSYGSADVDVATAVTATALGGAAIAGTQTSQTGNVDAIVLVSAADATLVWVAQYGGPFEDRPSGVIQRDDDTLLLAGVRGHADSPHALWLAALASDGNKLWSRLHAPKTDARVAALLGAEGGGGLVVGSERQADQTWRPRVRRFDAMGNLTWQRTWPWEPDSQLLAGDRLANGDLLLAGHRPLAAGGAVALLRTDAWGHAQCAEAGVCAGLTEAACDDATKCTADICEPGNGCQHGLLADGSPCAIGLSCAVSQCVP